MKLPKCKECSRKFNPRHPSTYLCAKCKVKTKPCACGCKTAVKIWNSASRCYAKHPYAPFHNPETRERLRAARARNATKKRYVCKCRYCRSPFSSVYSNLKTCPRCAKPKFCACGCGKTVKMPSKQYANGCHPNQSSAAHTAKIVAFHTGRKRSKVTVARIKAKQGTPERRALASRLCKAQAGKQSSIEKILHEALDRRVFKYAGLNKGKSTTPISADIVVHRLKLIVQVDGCFWHGCRLHDRSPAEKRRAKRMRDRRLTSYAESKGWTVLRFWEHDIRYNLDDVLLKIGNMTKRLKRQVSYAK